MGRSRLENLWARQQPVPGIRDRAAAQRGDQSRVSSSSVGKQRVRLGEKLVTAGVEISVTPEGAQGLGTNQADLGTALPSGAGVLTTERAARGGVLAVGRAHRGSHDGRAELLLQRGIPAAFGRRETHVSDA